MLRRRSLPALGGGEEHRVTTLELFFDLAYVFAITQVSALMAAGHDLVGIVQGLTVLALLWWSWAAYSWLSNHARADRGSVRVAIIVAMTSVFIAGLVVRESFAVDASRLAPLVFVAAYLVARLAHAGVYLLASFETEGLRLRVVSTAVLSLAPSAVLLLAGALLGAPWQLPCWLAAALYEPFAASLTGRGVDWQIRSIAHVAERHGLVIILALGESVIAIGSAVTADPISPSILVGAVLAIVLSVAMWWAYFSQLSEAAEERLERETRAAQARLATLGYTYLHLVLVAAIVLSAFGVEQVMADIGELGPFGVFGAAVLGSGTGAYLAGTALFARVVLGQWWSVRLFGAAALVISVPLLAAIPPIGALAFVGIVLATVLLVEARPGRAAPAAAPP